MNTEMEQLKGQLFGDRDDVYLVTTGSGGRKKVAHIPSNNEATHVLCGSMKKDSLRRVDSATVDRFYRVCKSCKRMSE